MPIEAKTQPAYIPEGIVSQAHASDIARYHTLEPLAKKHTLPHEAIDMVTGKPIPDMHAREPGRLAETPHIKFHKIRLVPASPEGDPPDTLTATKTGDLWVYGAEPINIVDPELLVQQQFVSTVTMETAKVITPNGNAWILNLSEDRKKTQPDVDICLGCRLEITSVEGQNITIQNNLTSVSDCPIEIVPSPTDATILKLTVAAICTPENSESLVAALSYLSESELQTVTWETEGDVAVAEADFEIPVARAIAVIGSQTPENIAAFGHFGFPELTGGHEISIIPVTTQNNKTFTLEIPYSYFFGGGFISGAAGGPITDLSQWILAAPLPWTITDGGASAETTVSFADIPDRAIFLTLSVYGETTNIGIGMWQKPDACKLFLPIVESTP